MYTVHMVAAILNLFEDEAELGVRDMSRRLSKSKSAIQRFAAGLADDGLLVRQPSGRYRLGLRLLELGVLVRVRSELMTVAEPTLRALANTTREATHLATLDGINVVYIAKFTGPNAIEMPSFTGAQNPAYCTGVGKAILAFQDQEFIDQVIEHGLVPFTEYTITTRDELLENLALTRKQGYAVDNEERALGLRCLAAPVHNNFGAVVASISIAGPTTRLSDKAIRLTVPWLKVGAERISKYLGWQPKGTGPVEYLESPERLAPRPDGRSYSGAPLRPLKATALAFRTA